MEEKKEIQQLLILIGPGRNGVRHLCALFKNVLDFAEETVLDEK